MYKGGLTIASAKSFLPDSGISFKSWIACRVLVTYVVWVGKRPGEWLTWTYCWQLRHVIYESDAVVNSKANFTSEASMHQTPKIECAIFGCSEILLHQRTEEIAVFLDPTNIMLSVIQLMFHQVKPLRLTGHALYKRSSSRMTFRNSRRSPKVGNVSNLR